MTNRSAVLTSLQNIEMQDRPMPEIGPDDVLLKVEYCGVCGSDVKFFEDGCIGTRMVTYPLVLGHEAAGEVVAVGANVKHLTPGTKAVAEPGVPCGHCEFCRQGRYNLCPDMVFLSCPPYDGFFSRYISVPASLVYPLPDGVNTLAGALIEPLAVGAYSAQKGEVRAGKTVTILGSGCIGLCALLACRQMGASRVIVVDLFQNRLDRAKALGADEVVNASECDAVEKILELTNGEGTDVVLETAGNVRTAAQTTSIVRRGGIIVVAGTVIGDVPFSIRSMELKEAELRTIWRYRNIFPYCVDAIATGGIPWESLRSIVDGIFEFEDTQKAFVTAMNDKQNIVKCVVRVGD